jgi:ribosomal protein L1
MSDREIADNIVAVLNLVESKGFSERISNVVLKTTMGPAIVIST